MPHSAAQARIRVSLARGAPIGTGRGRRAYLAFLHPPGAPVGITPPPVLTRVQGAKVERHGVAVFGHARVTAWHVPRTTRCRHQPPLPPPFMTTKGCPTAQRTPHNTTQAHMALQLHPHCSTHTDPSCSLHNATDHLLYWIGNRKNDGSNKRPQSAETRGRRVWRSPGKAQSSFRLHRFWCSMGYAMDKSRC